MPALDEHDVYPSPPPTPKQPKAGPVLATCLRYTLSKDDYQLLQKHAIAQLPRSIGNQLPPANLYNSIAAAHDEYSVSAVRASIRLFVLSQTGLQMWEQIKKRVLGKATDRRAIKTSVFKSPNLRLSLSLSAILLLHRILYRFFLRLRANLRSKDAAPFRRRNPRIARSLTSRVAPAIGASLAGFALAVYPADQLRLSAAIYSATRALEFLYNAFESDGYFKDRPWWWGSWMLTPLATGQLLQAFVFDRDCVPGAYTSFIMNHTPNYVQKRPPNYPDHLQWPSTDAIVDGLQEMSKLSWPPFISPILFPDKSQTLPPTLQQLSPITSPAHPIHTALSCATLHPSDPSCFRTFANYVLSAFPSIAKFFTLFYALFSIPRYRKWLADPTTEVGNLARKVLKTATFLTGAIGTSWGSICLFQYLFPRTFLPSARWFLGGFMGGLWAFVDRQGGRGQVMYSVRTSTDSLWKAGKKRGWWKGVKNGDVVLFVSGLAVMNILYDRRREAVDRGIGKGLGYLRGEPNKASKEGEETKTEREKR